MGHRGWLSRREALAGSALALAPGLVRAQPATPSTPTAPAETVSMVMPGNVTFRAKFFKPNKLPSPGVIVVHDGWGPTADFEVMGANLAFEGMMGLVIDLTGGKTAENAEEAERLAKQVDEPLAAEVISVWHDWIRNRLESDGRISAFGFGPGGRWATNGSLWKAVNGLALWSVRIENNPRELHSIYEFVIAHFSDRDITPGQVYVADLQQRLRAAQREPHLFRYGSRPAFYNPRSPDYDKPDASLAWRRTIAIYKKMWNLPPAR